LCSDAEISRRTVRREHGTIIDGPEVRPDRGLGEPMRGVSHFQQEPRGREQTAGVTANTSLISLNLYRKLRQHAAPALKPRRDSTSASASAAAKFTVSKQLQICAHNTKQRERHSRPLSSSSSTKGAKVRTHLPVPRRGVRARARTSRSYVPRACVAAVCCAASVAAFQLQQRGPCGLNQDVVRRRQRCQVVASVRRVR